MPEIAVVSEILQWVVLMVLAGLCGGLVYLVGDLQRRIGPDRGPLIPNEGLAVGSIAPRLVGMDPRRGVHTAIDSLSKPSLVAFLSPTCGPCVGLVEDLNRLAREQRDVDVLVVFSSGEVGIDFSRECSEEIRLVKHQDSQLFTAWQASKTPMVYLVDAERRVLHRTIPNNYLDLEDTIDEIGHAQIRPWVSTEPDEHASGVLNRKESTT